LLLWMSAIGHKRILVNGRYEVDHLVLAGGMKTNSLVASCQ
jgi:hypothetical protein